VYGDGRVKVKMWEPSMGVASRISAWVTMGSAVAARTRSLGRRLRMRSLSGVTCVALV
jgi:hypothetical protein